MLPATEPPAADSRPTTPNGSRMSSRRSSVTRIFSSGVIVGQGGIRFKLVDSFHRRHDFTGVALRLWFACACVGIGASGVALVVAVLVSKIMGVRTAVCLAAPSVGWRFLAWGGSGAIVAAGAMGLVKYLPSIAGSGLPEVKESLAGIMIFGAFTIKAVLVKPVALALAIASSLSIGKEGPFVHCACCIAYQIANAKWVGFNALVKEQRQIELLVAACAAGVVFTFCAPVGGVLFSAEITSTGLYNLDHLPRAFFCVTFSLALYHLVSRPLLMIIMGSDPFAMFPAAASIYARFVFTVPELVAFAIQGLLAAFIARLLEEFVILSAKIRPFLKATWGGWAMPSIIALICSVVNLTLSGGACDGKYTEGGMGVLKRLVLPAPSISESLAVDDAETVYSLLALFAFGALKLLVLSPLSLQMPVPTGVFLPTFVSGAALGSLYGSLLRRLLPVFFANTLPSYFAVTGAAALACAATKTMSTAVVTMELTGMLFLHIPILCATTTGYLIAGLLKTPSLFEAFVG